MHKKAATTTHRRVASVEFSLVFQRRDMAPSGDFVALATIEKMIHAGTPDGPGLERPG
ncbi:MAG: hypothetical protein M3R67_04200 [Acidobacteriota bacterium]|nr:hypothetical protein [Acidobacteriota bacterium]